MTSLNKVTLIGNLGKDPEMRYTKNQTPFARFSLATTEKYKDKETTQWHNLVVWGKQAEIAQRYLHKGKQIYVEGRIEYRDYDKDGQRRTITEIKVDRFLMLGSVGKRGARPVQQTTDKYGPPAQQYFDDAPESDSFNDDDIPF